MGVLVGLFQTHQSHGCPARMRRHPASGVARATELRVSSWPSSGTEMGGRIGIGISCDTIRHCNLIAGTTSDRGIFPLLLLLDVPTVDRVLGPLTKQQTNVSWEKAEKRLTVSFEKLDVRTIFLENVL